jgi:hypothetical protein
MMERSAKFISLSGLAGVLAGLYALVGAAAAYYIVHYPISPFKYRIYSIQAEDTLWKLIVVALGVLFFSISTGLYLSQRKAKKQGLSFWSSATRQLIVNLSIPMFTGGAFVLIMLYTGHFGLAAPACLIFYGIALVHGSTFTFTEVRYLGYCEIVLGLLSAAYPGYGLLSWAIGFGVLHIVYGAIMYNRYDK